MSPVQGSTEYEATHVAGYDGQRVDFTLFNITSKSAEGSSIEFGLAVVIGSSDQQCALPSAAGQRFLGISEYTSAGVVQEDGSHLYEENREVNIVDFGQIYVTPEVTVVSGEPVYFRHTAPGVETIGAFRNDSDDGNADIIEGAIWETGSLFGDIAVIKLTPQGYALAASETLVGTTDAISLGTATSLFDSTAGVNNATLADGYEGQTKFVKCVTFSSNVVITVATSLEIATITFDAEFEGTLLRFTGGQWVVVCNYNATIAAPI